MGFGWFFVGYFSVTVVSLYLPIFPPLAFAMLVGYPMIIYALWQLAPYHRYLRVSFYASFSSLPFALYYFLYALRYLGVSLSWVGASFAVMNVVYSIFTLLFTGLWLFALLSLSRELAHKKLLGGAIRSMIFFGVGGILYVVSEITSLFVKESEPYFAIPVLFLRVISIFVNMYFIYLCYRYIGPQEEDLPDLSLEPLQENAKGESKQ